MASIAQLGQSRKFQRYECASVALSKTGEALENYTKGILKEVHEQIHRKLAGKTLSNCQLGCSQHHGRQIRW